MRKYTQFNNFLLVAFLVILGFVFIFSAVFTSANSKDDIAYPVFDLGNCSSESECRAYCDQRDDADVLRACLGFAKEHNLLPPEVIAHGQKFIDVAVNGGPGGCKNEESCVSYCDNPAHMQECLEFAINYQLIPQDELSHAKKALGALKSGLKTPGSCGSQNECVAYCENPAHIDECLVFAEKSGILPPDEIEEAKKVAPFLKSGQTPGGCKSKAECEAYCSDDGNFEECISFAERAGFMDAKEAEFAKKFKGKSPGDCAKGLQNASDARRSCTEFCNKPENQPVCFSFAVEAGIMSAEEATQAGSLSDFQTCAPIAPQEIQECFIDNLGPELFGAMKQGVLPLEGDIEGMMAKIRESRKCVNRYADQSLQTFTDDPDAINCINSKLGADYLQRASRGEVKCGDAAPSQKIIASCIEEKLGEKIDRCFSLACSEATACLQNIQGRAGRMERGMEKGEIINLEIFAKLESKMNACVFEEIRGCLSKNCDEAIPCIQRTQSGAKTGGTGEGKLDPALEAEITAKVTECTGGKEGGILQPSEQQGIPGYKYKESEYPRASGGTTYEIPIMPEICANFTSVPKCSYTGATDSRNYQLCKKCYPDR